MSYPVLTSLGATPVEPPEAQSVHSMLHIVRILSAILGILLLLVGIAYAAAEVAAYNSCTSVLGSFCPGLGVLLIFPIIFVFWGVIDFVIFLEAGAIERLVNAGEYEEAKSKALVGRSSDSSSVASSWAFSCSSPTSRWTL